MTIEKAIEIALGSFFAGLHTLIVVLITDPPRALWGLIFVGFLIVQAVERLERGQRI